MCTLATITAIWVSIALISVLSPDMVHGSEHQRMPVAAFGAWFWGFGASIAAVVAMARLRRDVAQRPAVMMVAGVTTTIWVAATVVSIFGPTLVTGSDPTTIPLAALIAPIVAALVTTGIATVAVIAHGLSVEPPAPLTPRAAADNRSVVSVRRFISRPCGLHRALSRTAHSGARSRGESARSARSAPTRHGRAPAPG